jgi:RsiW-degrading membrane proteinase PrsW (M82 family)
VDLKAELEVHSKLKCTRYTFYAFTTIYVVGLAFLCYYCSWEDKKNPVLFIFVLSSFFTLVIFDSVVRITLTCWDHPELKLSIFVLLFQMLFIPSLAVLCYFSEGLRQKYIEAKSHKHHSSDVDQAEGDYLNALTAITLKILLLNMFNII